jgi:two-component system CheB/CheR fusion protein
VPETRPFSHLVVIGASAGGIEALSKLVSTLPKDFPAPIVTAQHLNPNQESHLEEILTRRSTLPVRTLKEHTALPLESGVVFVVPANWHVDITDSEIFLHEDTRGRPKPSIDLIFSSAAEIYGDRLIAVVLTGTGSDGTDGARAVKKAGGTVVIQNPETAAHPGMPRSLAPNTVDIVADLDRIGQVLHNLLRGLEVPTEPGEKRKLEMFLEEVRNNSGIDFRSYKTPTIMRRLQRRIVATNSGDLDGYTKYQEDHPEEYQHLVNSFLIKVTEFFRDRELFDFLREELIPELVDKARAQGNQLRIWSAGCATGEEAYSLAILVSEALKDDLEHFDVRIFATDVDEEAVNFARRGVYSEAALAGLPEDLIDRYFIEDGKDYHVKKQVRSIIIFGQHDLAQRAPFPRVDLVVCRNVLIYFTPELQRRALQLFAYSLKDGGYLLLGKSESPSPLTKFFTLHDKKHKIYQRQGERFLMPPVNKTDPTPLLLARNKPAIASTSPSAGARTTREAREAQETRSARDDLVHRFPVGVVVIDRKYDIQSINAAARRLLSISDPALGEDLLHMVQGTHYTELRAAIDTALREGKPAGVASFAIEEVTTGEQRYLQITCYPQADEGEEDHVSSVMIIVGDITDLARARLELEERLETTIAEFEQVSRQSQEERKRQEAINQRLVEANRQLNEANQDLTSLNEELQATNEQHLVSSEETQAATEEVETLNEELQATNEELETLNEELQATIEELNTTNEDLHARTGELQRLAAESEAHYQTSEDSRQRLRDILAQVPSMVAILRGKVQIFEFVNPSYLRLSGYERENLIGKPAGELFPEDRGLLELLDRVYESGEPEVTTQMPVRFDRAGDGLMEDISFDFAYQPLRNSDGEVEGVIIQGFDQTERVAGRERPGEPTEDLSGAHLRTVLASIPDAVLAVNATGEVLFANDAFERTFGPAEPGETSPTFVPRDEKGGELPPEETPQSRAARGEAFRLEFSAETAEGDRSRFEAIGRPLRDSEEGGVIVVREIAQ